MIMTEWTWVLIVGVALTLVYEIYAAVHSDDNVPTISQIVWKVSVRPVVPFAFGLLMGHLFL